MRQIAPNAKIRSAKVQSKPTRKWQSAVEAHFARRPLLGAKGIQGGKGEKGGFIEAKVASALSMNQCERASANCYNEWLALNYII